jgi:hypothetical protein
MLEVSNNSSSIARGCWKKYEFNYIQNLQPKRNNLTLTLGTVMHQAKAEYFAGATESDVLKGICDTYDTYIADSVPEEAEDFLTDKYTAIGMWTYAPKDLTIFKQILPEMEFKVKLPGLRGVRYVGRVDGLVQLSKNDTWWVYELKTTGLSPRQFIGRCNTSPQVTGYVYALREMGYPVQGVLFEAYKRPLLRKRKTENADEFGYRIIGDYKENQDEKFVLHTEYRPDYRIEQWLEAEVELVRDIRRMRRGRCWYRNYDQCWNYNSLCPFAQICQMDKPDALTLEMFYEKKEVR